MDNIVVYQGPGFCLVSSCLRWINEGVFVMARDGERGR
jgi:hypothetical protein